MEFHEGKKEMVAAAYSDNAAAGWNTYSCGAKLFLVAIYLRFVLIWGLIWAYLIFSEVKSRI